MIAQAKNEDEFIAVSRRGYAKMLLLEVGGLEKDGKPDEKHTLMTLVDENVLERFCQNYLKAIGSSIPEDEDDEAEDEDDGDIED